MATWLVRHHVAGEASCGNVVGETSCGNPLPRLYVSVTYQELIGSNLD